ncbi:hypothetical protein [Vibrio mexicanus]|uniref:hypothetical protein n=1 Tax=Vibrio mexicanus TaxID=1004326 RepID=UPI00063C0C4E|nr:hypothetical protein [Vibrio mexicanus]
MEPLETRTLVIEKALSTTQADKPACFSCFGNVQGLCEEFDLIKVDFKGNPFRHPIPAKLQHRYLRHELQHAAKGRFGCHIKFHNGDLTLPIVEQIFFVASEKSQLCLQASRVLLEAQDLLTVKSREALQSYSKQSGRLLYRAKAIDVNASKGLRILGATVALN